MEGVAVAVGPVAVLVGDLVAFVARGGLGCPFPASSDLGCPFPVSSDLGCLYHGLHDRDSQVSTLALAKGFRVLVDPSVAWFPGRSAVLTSKVPPHESVL